MNTGPIHVPDDPLGIVLQDGDFMRCPFMRAIAEDREADARVLAAQPPDPAEPVVIEWLVAAARARLQAQSEGHDDP